jgi:histone H3/H4
MILKSRAIRDICKDCKIPEHIIDQYFEEITQLVWRIAKKERNFCRTKVRGWVFSTDIGKPSILEVLKDEDHELL